VSTRDLRTRLQTVRAYLGTYGWLALGGAILVLVGLQWLGPLSTSRASLLFFAVGLFLVVWNLLLLRATGVLEFAHDHAWTLLAVFAVGAVAVQAAGLLNSYWSTVALQMFMFGVLALSWDLIGGQTGYPSFGNMAFFGIGGYTAAVLFKNYGVALPLTLVVAAVMALVFAAIIGVIVLRLRGGYFAIATLGVLLVAIQVARNLSITGGTDGIILLDVPDQALIYYGMLAVLVTEIAVVYYLSTTRFGYVLNTIRDDERKATAMGINTTYYKTAAWGLSALFTGLVGAMWAPYNTFIDPATAFNTAWNVEFIVMAFIGGTGTVIGPVLGAFGIRSLVFQIDSLFTGWQLVVLGVVVIVTVIGLPEGLVGQLKQRASALKYYEYGGGAAGGAEAADADATEGGND